MMNVSKKFICIHGHFYQPPRENAWLEAIELQDSAYPFHDWNERINFECYAPNTAARVLDSEKYIIDIINNYSRISFNFGPTLLSWMENADPETYAAIIEADYLSRQKFNGHGSAIAQAYGHLILPLANRRDKVTQVLWGIQDFQYRFGRAPEGMWLAETAVDTETLEILAENNIKYTILAPRQAKAFRKTGYTNWENLPYENIDPRRPYVYNLPSGKTIALFFYHGEIAQGVAFKGLLNNGRYFAHQFLKVFDHNSEPQLAHIATDGESYGHHHRFGEMALADAITYVEKNRLAVITNYAEYLELFPPEYEVQIHENSSWSCIHGIERWRSNCGCNTGGRPGWTQQWRQPLRNTLNWLRDEIIPIFEKQGGEVLKDIWKARDEYIQVVLNRKEENVRKFLDAHLMGDFTNDKKILALRLLEMQRQAMQMFTSCGWFFDEISGIETNQILQYANRAIYYADQITGINLHDQFVEKLDEAPSNVFANGADSYIKNVVPSSVNLKRVAMHYAVASLFEPKPQNLELFNYKAESEIFERFSAGKQLLSLGRTTVKSTITQSEKQFSFAVLYLGQHHIIGNISIDMDWKTFVEMSDKVIETFKNSDLGGVIGTMQSYFDSEKFTIWHLFNEEKRKIIQQITELSLQRVEADFREIYYDNYQLMSSMLQTDIPVPEAYITAVKFILNQELLLFFKKEQLDVKELKRLLGELKKWKVLLDDEASFDLTASERIYSEIKRIEVNQDSLKDINLLNETLEVLNGLDLEIDVWKSQNEYFSLLSNFKQGKLEYPSLEWLNAFTRLGELLMVRG